ncbi:MAG: DUF3311 domain-containing protein [Ktedonobacterales bacterium]|nr:DUF3311 domain-containing protein [Ktedonobacterales bacterium]
MRHDSVEGNKRKQLWLLLLLIPFIATLWMPFYAREQPELAGGIPFFYWYLFLWVILSALLTALVYRMTR